MDEELEKNYEKAGYHATQERGGNLAVIFIDFANALKQLANAIII